MTWRTVGFLAVTLRRQHVHALAGCAPSLESPVARRLGWSVVGTLKSGGRPRRELSLGPRRSFELPSARRVGQEDDGDRETLALSQGGVGGGAPVDCGADDLNLSFCVCSGQGRLVLLRKREAW